MMSSKLKRHVLFYNFNSLSKFFYNTISFQRQARKLGPTYLTETPYLASDDNFDESEISNQLRHPPLRKDDDCEQR